MPKEAKPITADDHPDRLLNDREAAALLGLAVQTLRDWRCGGRVPLPFVKVGSAVRYRLGDLVGFIAEHRVSPRGAA